MKKICLHFQSQPNCRQLETVGLKIYLGVVRFELEIEASGIYDVT